MISQLAASALSAVLIIAPAAVSPAHTRVDGWRPAPIGVDRDDGCERTGTTVRLAPTGSATVRIAGWLCGPRTPADGGVEFLIHGFSYNHTYWFGLGMSQYSYVRAATLAGRTTFVIDQVGAGASDHPDPTEVTFATTAWIAHQLVTGLRAGRIGRSHTRFHRVVGVGHSMGAGTWLIEAGSFHDVDAVIVANFAHATDPGFVSRLRTTNYVIANTRTRFRHLPPGYLTVEPRSIFYATPHQARTEEVIDADERIGVDTGTVGQVATLASARDPSYSRAITVPVLLVTGRQDPMFCNEAIGLSCADASAVLARETAFYTGTRCLGAVVVDAGHSTTLHPAAPDLFAFVDRWLRATQTTTVATGGPVRRAGTSAIGCAPR